jgi:hypothetical protein
MSAGNIDANCHVETSMTPPRLQLIQEGSPLDAAGQADCDERWHSVRSGLRIVYWGWVPHLLATAALLAMLALGVASVLGAQHPTRALWAARLAYLVAAAVAAVGLREVARGPGATGLRWLGWSGVVCFLVSLVVQISGLGALGWVEARTGLPLGAAERAVASTGWLLSPLAEGLGIGLLLLALFRTTRAVQARPPTVVGGLIAGLLLAPIALAVWPHVPGAHRLTAWVPLAVRLTVDLLLLVAVGGVAVSLWMAPRPARRRPTLPVEPAVDIDHDAWIAPSAGLGAYAMALRPAVAVLALGVGLGALGAEVLPARLWRVLSPGITLATGGLAVVMAVGLLRYAGAPRASGARPGAIAAALLFLGVAAVHGLQGGQLVAAATGHAVSLGVPLSRALAVAGHVLPLLALLALTPSLGRVAEHLAWPEIAWRALPLTRLVGLAIAAVLLADLARISGALGGRPTLFLGAAALALGVVAAARHLGVVRLLCSAVRQASEPPPATASPGEQIWEAWERSLQP